MMRLAWLAAILFAVTSYTLADHAGDEDEDYAAILKIFGGLNKYLDLYCEFTFSHEACQEIRSKIHFYPETSSLQSFPTCQECLASIGLVVELIDQGYHWEDMIPLLLGACDDFYSSQGKDAQAMCPGTLNNYAPHVEYILSTTGLSAEDFCVITQSCSEDEIPNPGPPSARREKWRSGQKTHQTDGLLPPKPKERKHKPSDKKSTRNTIKVAHFSDIHVDREYVEGAPSDCGMLTCCREKYEGEGEAMRYGEMGCEIPSISMDLAFNATREMGVEFVLYVGDTNPGLPWEETQEMQLTGTSFLAERATHLLSDYGIPVYPVIGNHESWPANLYYLERDEIKELNVKFAEDWHPAADFHDDEIANVVYGGYYQKELMPGLRLLAYNSNYGYTFNWYNVMSLDGTEVHYPNMLNWMNQVLEDARNAGEKVIVNGHHPTGDQENFISYAEDVLDIFDRYSDIIVLNVYGHYHSDQFKLIWRDGEAGTEAVGVEFIGASLTTTRNPAFRVYEIDADTYEVLDFSQYYMVLEDVADAEPDTSLYILMYQALEEYDMKDMSPESWRDFAERMSEDDELLDKYYQNKYTREGDRSCTGSCPQTELCYIWNPTWDMVKACIEQ